MRFLKRWSSAICFSSFRLVSVYFLSSLSTQEKENDEEDYVLPCSNSEAVRACVLSPNARLISESPSSALHVYSAFQVRPFDKIFNDSLMVRPIKHANGKCHEYLYMFEMKTFVLDKKCVNHDHRVRAHRYLITPWFVSVPSGNMYISFL